MAFGETLLNRQLGNSWKVFFFSFLILKLFLPRFWPCAVGVEKFCHLTASKNVINVANKILAFVIFIFYFLPGKPSFG